MTSRTIVILILNVSLLAGFYFGGIHQRPAELHFEYQKLFILLGLGFVLVELLKFKLHSFFPRSIFRYLGKVAFSDSREIEELPPQHPLYPVYAAILQLLERYTKKQEQGTDFTPLPILQTLWNNKLPILRRIQNLLEELHNLFPDSELYLFAVGHNKIYLVEHRGADELLNGGITNLRNRSLPFSITSDFSGKAFGSKEVIITNELKSDPNLGQFISPDNHNIPIYGALFPISSNERTNGFLWIRDGSQTMESVTQKEQFFGTLSQLLQQEFFSRSTDIDFTKVNQEELFLHYQNKSQFFWEMAKHQKVPFAVMLSFTRYAEQKRSNIHQQKVLEYLIAELPTLSVQIHEDDINYITILGLNRDQLMTCAAKAMDQMVNYLTLNGNGELLGHVNMGIACDIPGEDDHIDNYQQRANQALKLAVSQGVNKLRVG